MTIRQSLQWLACACALFNHPVLAQPLQDLSIGPPSRSLVYIAVLGNLSTVIDERPADVKAAIARLFPDIDAATLDLISRLESRAWEAQPLTANDVAPEIRFLKSGGMQLPDTDKLDVNSLLLIY